MNRYAIYSDGTSDYRQPAEPKTGELVTIRLRVAKGEQGLSVFLYGNGNSYNMSYSDTDGMFDYYSVSITVTDAIFNYYFELHQANETVFFDRVGASDNIRNEYNFSITPDFSTPDWAKGAVMYQIYVDRFYNGDSSNDVESKEYYYIQTYSDRVKNWDKPPANFGVAEFYGGDLEGVRQKLYYLKSLGVEVIYFNPLFVSPSNHKYDIADYDYIDPHYGKIIVDEDGLLNEGDKDNSHATKFKRRVTDLANLKASNAFFAQFVDEAHAKGIRVILDGVFNHCGSFNKWLDRENIYDESFGYPEGAYEDKSSPYHSYFRFGRDEWPNNGSYEGWWGHDTLPKLNYDDSPELYNYIMKIAAKWVSAPYNCDGWRLDVAADLGHSEEFNHKFWRDFRKAVKDANPNAVVLAEHYGDPRAWLDGSQWDTIMNYDAFMEPVSFFLTGMEKHSDRFEKDALGDGERFKNTMLHFMARMKTPSLYCSMNQLSNHDHSRFLTRTNHKVGRVQDLGSAAAGEGVSVTVLRLATMLMMTWPGAPTLYYGDEAGVVGFTDPDNRRTYPWGSADYELVDFHRDVIMLHKSSPAIRRGSFLFLECGKDFISYARFNKNEHIIVCINSGENSIEQEVSTWRAGIPNNAEVKCIMVCGDRGHSIMPIPFSAVNGKILVKLTAYTGIVVRYEN